MSLAWSLPKDNGGSDVTGYIVEKREALRMSWQRVAQTPDTSLIIPHLKEGVSYIFQVSAINAIGVSAPEELPMAVTPKCPHSEYTNISVQSSFCKQFCNCVVLNCIVHVSENQNVVKIKLTLDRNL